MLLSVEAGIPAEAGVVQVRLRAEAKVTWVDYTHIWPYDHAVYPYMVIRLAS